MTVTPDPSPPTVLTEDERADLEGACAGWGEYLCCQRMLHRVTKEPVGGQMLDVVERILAKRLAAQRAAIVAGIEALPVTEMSSGFAVNLAPHRVRREAANVARDGGAS